MNNSGLEILIILLLILANSFFAATEIALVASRTSRLQTLATGGARRASTVLKLREKFGETTAAVQVGVTVVGTLAAALGGASAVRQLAPLIAFVPGLAAYAEAIAVGLVVVVISYLQLIFGELMPKRLAMQNPEGTAMLLSAPFYFWTRLANAPSRLLSASTDLVMRLLGVKPSLEPPITEEEIQVLIDQGTQAGVFKEAEHDMVEGVFSLGDQRVYSLMTPRTDVVWLDISDTTEEIREKIAGCEFSRFPVRQGALDVMLGIVKARDLLVPSLRGEEIKLKDLLKPAFFIPETMFASRALEIFKEKGTEILLVIDEFGGAQGLLTINDILEEIVGQVEIDEPQATQRQDGSWLLDGMLAVDEFKEIFSLPGLPHEDEYETLSGFVMMSLGRVPQTADHFEWHGLRFEVIDMDGQRVDKVLVTTLPQHPATQEPVKIN